jgi:hypothetical protein
LDLYFFTVEVSLVVLLQALIFSFLSNIYSQHYLDILVLYVHTDFHYASLVLLSFVHPPSLLKTIFSQRPAFLLFSDFSKPFAKSHLSRFKRRLYRQQLQHQLYYQKLLVTFLLSLLQTHPYR